MTAAEEMGRLRVPLASLAGFDPVGLVVDGAVIVSRAEEQDNDEAGWAAEFATLPPPSLLAIATVEGVRFRVAAEVSVTLADASTADRVARWVAGRVGLEVGCTAPGWREGRQGGLGLPGWLLDTGDGSKFFTYDSLPVVRAFWMDDDRLLPDGSRYVDRLALALVAVHVGGQP